MPFAAASCTARTRTAVASSAQAIAMALILIGCRPSDVSPAFAATPPCQLHGLVAMHRQHIRAGYDEG